MSHPFFLYTLSYFCLFYFHLILIQFCFVLVCWFVLFLFIYSFVHFNFSMLCLISQTWKDNKWQSTKSSKVNKKAGRLNDKLSMNYSPWWPLTFVRCANITQQTRPMCLLYACLVSFMNTVTIVAAEKSVFRCNSQFFHKLWPLMTFYPRER